MPGLYLSFLSFSFLFSFPLFFLLFFLFFLIQKSSYFCFLYLFGSDDQKWDVNINGFLLLAPRRIVVPVALAEFGVARLSSNFAAKCWNFRLKKKNPTTYFPGTRVIRNQSRLPAKYGVPSSKKQMLGPNLLYLSSQKLRFLEYKIEAFRNIKMGIFLLPSFNTAYIYSRQIQSLFVSVS